MCVCERIVISLSPSNAMANQRVVCLLSNTEDRSPIAGRIENTQAAKQLFAATLDSQYLDEVNREYHFTEELYGVWKCVLYMSVGTINISLFSN